MNLRNWFRFACDSWRPERGQTMAEYGVVLAVITVLTVSVFTLLGGAVSNVVQRVLDAWPS
jgi:Flp pilus assembly pilin Flp